MATVILSSCVKLQFGNYLKTFLLFGVIFLNTRFLIAQKRSIDVTELGNWLSVSNPCISNDGEFVGYNTEVPAGYTTPKKNVTLIIRSQNGTWKKEIPNGQNFTFLENSRFGVFTVNDSLYMIEIGKDPVKFVADASLFDFPAAGQNNWIAYQLKNETKDVVLRDVASGQERIFPNAESFAFDRSRQHFLIQLNDSKDSCKCTVLKLLSLPKMETKEIWSSDLLKDAKVNPSSLIFDGRGKQLLFSTTTNDSPESATIWYYNTSMDRAKIKVSAQTAGISGYTIGSITGFSQNGKWIFFNLQEPWSNKIKDSTAASVDLWSYKDAILQPAQSELPATKTLTAVMQSNADAALRIFGETDKIETFPDKITGDFIVIADNYVFQHNYFPTWWKWSKQPVLSVMSLVDGHKIPIGGKDWNQNIGTAGLSFSPLGKYLIFFDSKIGSYFSCELATGKIINVTKGVSVKLTDDFEYGEYNLRSQVGQDIFWFTNDKAFIIYDNYDMWKIDPAGGVAPRNLTRGYGTKTQTQLRLLHEPTLEEPIDDLTDRVLLVGFNILNKYNGFYQGFLIRNIDPQLLTMGPYTYYHAPSQAPAKYIGFDEGMEPLKVANAKCWLVKRQSVTNAPNYFITRDLKTFTPVSDIQPQKDINWINGELITWKEDDSSILQGILYKPEDFNPDKKYPVIIHHYRRFSDRLYEFPMPNLTRGDMNIPWFVSQGYLVLTPDIHFLPPEKAGKGTSEQAYNAIISAVNYLSKLSYIDTKRLGIQGHSFGGGTTSYIITKTSVFAAAAEASGLTDLVSGYSTLIPFYPPGTRVETMDKQLTLETQMGGTLWAEKDRYLASSAVLNADKVKTPLLIMHNKLDGQIQWRQSVELYLSLRRLGQKVWMLQYDNEDHTVIDDVNALDYTIRLTQYFDYYLKGKLPAKWMTEGVPAKLKGIETGYAPDESGAKP
ncbi:MULTISPECIES: alpha/beta hydrolase family protein [Niastella]|uniref:S9 family peptidase n=1 Tax=Niastella soli TaxID=2821487 RepID=A0ABS3Z398_9BACT|nr:prolyl oligopeptidase family serine peptidase [Niastella soli]MBO9204651.1 S9 family peptidase [Niastella soli]